MSAFTHLIYRDIVITTQMSTETFLDCNCWFYMTNLKVKGHKKEDIQEAKVSIKTIEVKINHIWYTFRQWTDTAGSAQKSVHVKHSMAA